MQLTILGTESLGVRCLCCVIEINDRKIVIDPGVALGPKRYGLAPHPLEVAVSEQVRTKILAAVSKADDIVFSHYHGDHVPLARPDSYQIGACRFSECSRAEVRYWVQGSEAVSSTSRHRRRELLPMLPGQVTLAEEVATANLAFSGPMAHGEKDRSPGVVMMTRVVAGEQVVVHASDIQLFDSQAIEQILQWQPTLVIVSGPPLYLPQIDNRLRQHAWDNAVQLVKNSTTAVIDHHLLRSVEGFYWLDHLAQTTGNRVCCAADFMAVPRLPLEAWRQQLYERFPVSGDWHEQYRQGNAPPHQYAAAFDEVQEWAKKYC